MDPSLPRAPMPRPLPTLFASARQHVLASQPQAPPAPCQLNMTPCTPCALPTRCLLCRVGAPPAQMTARPGLPAPGARRCRGARMARATSSNLRAGLGRATPRWGRWRRTATTASRTRRPTRKKTSLRSRCTSPTCTGITLATPRQQPFLQAPACERFPRARHAP